MSKQPAELDQYVPDEKAQIVVNYEQGPNLILRYRKVKSGLAAYTKLVKAWKAALDTSFSNKKPAPRMLFVQSDMFNSTVYLLGVTTISFVDHAKRAAFKPIQ